MKKTELKQAIEELDKNRDKMQYQLLSFADTDLLFFFSDKSELANRQKQKWQPILTWAEKLLGVRLNITRNLEVPDNNELLKALPKMFSDLNNKEFCCWYAAMLNLRSVLLALAMVKRKIDADEAFELSAMEELWQNEQWGEDKEALVARKLKKDELSEIERFLLCEM